MEYGIYGLLAVALGLTIKSYLVTKQLNEVYDKDSTLKTAIKDLENKKAADRAEVEKLTEEIKNNKLKIVPTDEAEKFWNKK